MNLVRPMVGPRPPAAVRWRRRCALAVTAPARPGFTVCLVAELLGGVVGATVPSALGAREDGAGIGVGLSFGAAGALWVACVVLPMMIAILVQRDAEDARDLHLAGWPWGVRFIDGPVVAAGWLTATVVVASLAGGLVGLSDAVRHGGSLWSQPEPVAIPWLILLTSTLLTVAVLALGAPAVLALGISLGSWAVFIGLLWPTRGTVGRDVLSFLPLAPAWARTYPGQSYRLALDMSPLRQLVVLAAWTVLIVAVTIAHRGRDTRLTSGCVGSRRA